MCYPQQVSKTLSSPCSLSKKLYAVHRGASEWGSKLEVDYRGGRHQVALEKENVSLPYDPGCT